MATRTVTGTILRANGTPWVGAQVQFSLRESTYTANATFPRNVVTVVAANGTFSVELEADLGVYWECSLPSSTRFIFALPAGLPISIETLQADSSISVPINDDVQIAMSNTARSEAADLIRWGEVVFDTHRVYPWSATVSPVSHGAGGPGTAASQGVASNDVYAAMIRLTERFQLDSITSTIPIRNTNPAAVAAGQTIKWLVYSTTVNIFGYRYPKTVLAQTATKAYTAARQTNQIFPVSPSLIMPPGIYALVPMLNPDPLGAWTVPLNVNKSTRGVDYISPSGGISSVHAIYGSTQDFVPFNDSSMNNLWDETFAPDFSYPECYLTGSFISAT